MALREFEIATHNLGESVLLRHLQRRVCESWDFQATRLEWKFIMNESTAHVISKIGKGKCLRILLQILCHLLRKINDGRYWFNSRRSTSIDGQNPYYLNKIKTKSNLLQSMQACIICTAVDINDTYSSFHLICYLRLRILSIPKKRCTHCRL
jgi:hypothetical protein